ncbi:MAG: YcgN family cysteine cluster protein [Proteobacteria bacterium]|nr:YcgN family cysteine cluster protein [Pseudomonadota bacterium]
MSEFWRNKTLGQLNPQEWEAVCDGCARCCLIKLQDEDTDEIFFTDLVCDSLDLGSCRCTHYPQRHVLVPDCIQFETEQAYSLEWLPVSCGYRRMAEGRPLAWWHPLVSGSADTVHTAGISVRGRVSPCGGVPEYDQEDHIIRWVEC